MKSTKRQYAHSDSISTQFWVQPSQEHFDDLDKMYDLLEDNILKAIETGNKLKQEHQDTLWKNAEILFMWAFSPVYTNNKIRDFHLIGVDSDGHIVERIQGIDLLLIQKNDLGSVVSVLFVDCYNMPSIKKPRNFILKEGLSESACTHLMYKIFLEEREYMRIKGEVVFDCLRDIADEEIDKIEELKLNKKE